MLWCEFLLQENEYTYVCIYPGHEGNKAFKYEFCVKKFLPQRANQNHHAAYSMKRRSPFKC